MALPEPRQVMRPHYEAHFTEEGFELVGEFRSPRRSTADGY
jgi:hypothetical protein